MNKVECPQCGGDGHHGDDEDGFLYTCYACHGTGVMTEEEEAQDYTDTHKDDTQ